MTHNHPQHTLSFLNLHYSVVTDAPTPDSTDLPTSALELPAETSSTCSSRQVIETTFSSFELMAIVQHFGARSGSELNPLLDDDDIMLLMVLCNRSPSRFFEA
jgi:hypothetical protein